MLIMFSLTIRVSFIFLFFMISAQGADYYVDKMNGADSNPGTEKAPWKRIAKVNATKFVPNDRIKFKRGETWAETLIPSSSGSAAKPIVYEDYGTGPLPQITGATNQDCITWASTRSFLTFRNLHLKNCGQPDGKKKGGFNVWSEGSLSKAIVIERCLIESGQQWNIYMTGIDNLIIRNNVIRNAELEHGIYLDGTLGLHNAVIEGNEIYGNNIMCVQFNSNGVERLTGITLMYNKLYACGKGGVNNIGTAGLIAHHNLIFGDMPGIYNGCDGADSECRAGATQGIYSNNTIITSGASWATCFANGSSVGTPDFKEFINNVCVHNAKKGPIFAHEESSKSAISNYNIFFSGSGASTKFVWNNRDYSNFTDYQNNTGQDKYSFYRDPLFEDEPNAIYRLSVQSPAIDTGIDLTFKRDIAGNHVPMGMGPERGAFEYLVKRRPIIPTNLRLEVE